MKKPTDPLLPGPFVRRLLPVLLICFISFFQSGLGWKEPGPSKDLSFSRDREGDRHLFRASVFIKAEPVCVLETIYQFYHLQQLLQGEADLVALLRQGNDYYEVRFVHKSKLYVLDTVYRRTLQKDLNRVAFELLETKQEGRIIPKILSSNGYYALNEVPDGVRVDFFEEARISTTRWDPRTAGFVQVVERDTLSFLKRLKKYAEKTACRHP